MRMDAGRSSTIHLDHQELKSDRTDVERSFDSDRLKVQVYWPQASFICWPRSQTHVILIVKSCYCDRSRYH